MSYPRIRQPFPWQSDGARFIYRKRRVMLAWAMGTGKTQAALDFIGTMLWHKRIARALIICKLRGLAVWEAEIKEVMHPSVTYAMLRPGPMSSTWRKSDIILVNYDYARTQLEELRSLAPDVIAIDESHRIKNPHARQSRLAHKLGKVCDFAICLSGTPIGNRPMDLWSQFRFLKPDLLDEKFKDFKQNYMIFGGFGGYEVKKYKHLDQLGKLLHPYVSVQKSTIRVGKTFIEVPVDMPHEAKKQYQDMDKDFVAYINSETKVSAPIILAKLTKLSQISGGFIHDTETKQDFPLHTAKLEALKEHADSLLEQGEKRVVIFARFLWELEQIKQLLADHWVTFTIKGGVTIAEQKLAESLFKKDGGAMLCQIASGSESLNLQSCNYVFFYSFDYSLINFQQAIHRVFRQGQKAKTCFYYIFMCKATRDRAIYRILRGKKEMAKEMMRLIREGGAA